MYALIRTDGLLDKDNYVKVFSTHEDAYLFMSNDFSEHVREHGLEIADGYCFIYEWGAYDTPDASGNEWKILEAEDCRS